MAFEREEVSWGDRASSSPLSREARRLPLGRIENGEREKEEILWGGA